MDLIERKLQGKLGGYILDVATTAGDFIQTLIKNLKEYNYAIGIDITEKDFDEGRKKFPEGKVSLVKMDGASLAFRDDFFDIVSINAGLHHLSDVKKALSDMKRVLKPGGLLILKEMYCDNQNKKQMSDVRQHHWHSKIDRLTGISHNQTLKREKIIEYAEELSMKNIEIEDYYCKECNPETDGKMVDELKEIKERLTKIKNLKQYNELKNEAEAILKHIKDVGYACATRLEIIGIK